MENNKYLKEDLIRDVKAHMDLSFRLLKSSLSMIQTSFDMLEILKSSVDTLIENYEGENDA